MDRRRTAAIAAARPLRGQPEETRERVVRAAAEAFNRHGYTGTDSNRIARAAGYSPGTFYKHFADKREVFLAVYEEWVAREWRDVSSMIAAGGDPADLAERIVRLFLKHHARWRGFRASLRALVAHDAVVRDFYRSQRRRQLALVARFRARLRVSRSRAEDALLLFAIERTADALAEREPQALGVGPKDLRALLVRLIEEHLTPDGRAGRTNART